MVEEARMWTLKLLAVVTLWWVTWTYAQAATFTVNNTSDIPDASPGNGVCETASGNGVCTLRAAIQESNARSGNDLIILPSNTYVLSIVADLVISDNLTITGSGASTTIIDGNRAVRPSNGVLTTTGTVTINGVTIQNGARNNVPIPAGGGIFNRGRLTLASSTVKSNTAVFGGGLYNFDNGTLTLTNTTVSGNIGSSTGGGIFNEGELTLANSTVAGNIAAFGGGVFNELFMTVTDSTVSGNTASQTGGGIFHQSTTTLALMRSTFSQNSAHDGGGIFINSGAIMLTNSTVSGNRAASNGGGVYLLSSTVNAFNATITNNLADADLDLSGTGGGVLTSGASFNFSNTILAGNFVGAFSPPGVPSDCSGTINSLGVNLMESIAGCSVVPTGGVTVTAAQLGPLQNNGGPTLTHAPLAGSPAIEAGASGGCQSNTGELQTDQRGAPRHFDGDGNGTMRCDFGSVEFDGVPGAQEFSDFDGDGKADVGVYNTATAAWSIIRSSDGGFTQKLWGGPAWVPVPADYDGDGKVDIAVRNPSSGLWSIFRSLDGGNTLVGWSAAADDIPVPADYDGDGKSDLAVYNTASAGWSIIRSSDSALTYTPWGGPGWVHVEADYDGDGKADIAVRHPNGLWSIVRSTDGGNTLFGWSAALDDIPVPADYDGDGKADLAVYNSVSAGWSIIRSSDSGLTYRAWGGPAWEPVPADYDGDGKTDIAVYNSSNGLWSILRSSDGGNVLVGLGGAPQDVPLN